MLNIKKDSRRIAAHVSPSSDSTDAVYTIRAAMEPQSSYYQTKGGATVFIPQRPTVEPWNEWKEQRY